MSARAAAIVLVAAAVLTIPFPLFGLDGSFVPVARYAQLAVVLLAVIAQEGTGGMVGLFAGLIVGHVAVYGAVLVLVTWLVRRFVLDRLSPRGRIGVVSALVVCLLGATSFTPLYDSQFHHESAHARLWELYR
ncbi:MAG: hypothetical protein VCC20_03715 [Myxococcota bacterium]